MTTNLRSKVANPMAASIEVMPKQVLESSELASLFPAGTWVYLPDVGVDDVDTLVEAASRLRQCGYEPVPHFPVRRRKSGAYLETRAATGRRAVILSLEKATVLSQGLAPLAKPKFLLCAARKVCVFKGLAGFGWCAPAYGAGGSAGAERGAGHGSEIPSRFSARCCTAVG